MRVALAHDWLTGMRGGEKVLEAFCEMYADADLFTLLHVPGSVAASIERHRIRKRIEEAFGWIKTVAGLRKTRFRGLARVDLAFTFVAAAYNLVRIPRLLAGASP